MNLSQTNAATERRRLSSADWPLPRFAGPRIIGHRGACHHAVENTLQAFRLAHLTGADMWELDVRTTADGVCVVSHDDNLTGVFAVEATISQLSFSQLRELAPLVPAFSEVLELARELESGLYIELKDAAAGLLVLQQLRQSRFEYAALGSFVAEWVKSLAGAECEYPLSVLVPVGADPFVAAAATCADVIHLCWEKAGERPQDLVTAELLQRAVAQGLEVVLWHEERPAIIQALMQLPVLGVCSDRPELLVPFADSPARPLDVPAGIHLPQLVCHRGAELIAPENTLAAIERVFQQGIRWAEIDVQETADGQLVICHDEELQRTTDGSGRISEQTLDQLLQLDAGSHFSAKYAGERLPTLQQAIKLARRYQACLYIELKAVSADKLLAVVTEYDFLEACFFWSFNAGKLTRLRQLSSVARIMAREEDFPTIQAAKESISAWVIEVLVRDGADLPAIAAAVRAAGCLLMFCYQGSDPAVCRQLLELQPDLINQRRPDLFKQQMYQLCTEQSAGQSRVLNRN